MQLEQLELIGGGTLTLYLRESVEAMPHFRQRPLVLVVPGGGYNHVSPREGDPVALQFAAAGYHTAVLTYSVGEGAQNYRPLRQLNEALALLRQNAGEWHILPDKIAKTLTDNERIQWFASKYASAKDAFFIGRGLDYAVALEGSLKFKEISYIHSEAFAAGEMKHGPIALIDEGFPVIAIATKSPVYDKVVSNLQESKARGAMIVAEGSKYKISASGIRLMTCCLRVGIGYHGDVARQTICFISVPPEAPSQFLHSARQARAICRRCIHCAR